MSVCVCACFYSGNVSHARPHLSPILCSVQRATSINHTIKITSVAPGWLVHYPGRLNSRPGSLINSWHNSDKPHTAHANSSSTVVLAGVWVRLRGSDVLSPVESNPWCKQTHIAHICGVRSFKGSSNLLQVQEVYDLFGESKLLAAYVTIILHAWLQSTDFLWHYDPAHFL